jgi:hypothetical protein
MELERLKLEHEGKKLQLERDRHQVDPNGGGAQQLLKSVHDHLTSPVEIVRDQNGRVTGMRRLTN